MEPERIITEADMRKIIPEGKDTEFEVEKGWIRRFARAIGDSNPLWQDDQYAACSRFGGIIAPPTFLGTVGVDFNPYVSGLAKIGDLLPEGVTLMDGGTEIECFKAVRPGDRIVCRSRVGSIIEVPAGRMGKLALVPIETDCYNQSGELVTKSTSTLAAFRSRSAKEKEDGK